MANSYMGCGVVSTDRRDYWYFSFNIFCYKWRLIIMELFLAIIIGVIYFACTRGSVNAKLDNYDMTKVSAGKMAADKAKGLSTYEIRKNTVAGKYDKDANWKI